MLIMQPIVSQALTENLLHDPAERDLVVYLPPGYHASGRRYPTLYLLHGFGMHARDWTYPFPHGGGLLPPIDEIFDAAVAKRRAAPMIVVAPDGWSQYGCSQWVDSPVNGRFERYIVEEVIPHVDARYRTIPSPESRGIFGISSGGFGAWHLASRHPDVFAAMDLLSADSYFEHTHKPWLYNYYDSIYPDPPRGPVPGNFWSALSYGLASCYSPNVDNPPYYVDLPIAYPSGAVVAPLWERWLSYDPVVSWRERLPALCQMRGILLDVGYNDEWDLHYGHRLLSQGLSSGGIRHDVEEHAGTHAGRLYERLQVALDWFSQTLETAG